MTDVVPSPNGAVLLARLEEAGAFTSTGLRLADPDLTYDEYAAIGCLLGEMRKAIQWAIGDYIVLGEQLFGELAFQAVEGLEVSEEGLREYARVSMLVPKSRRRARLSWSHHRAVSRLEPQKQAEWLKTASERGLSHHQLREALREGAPPSPSVCRCCHRPL